MVKRSQREVLLYLHIGHPCYGTIPVRVIWYWSPTPFYIQLLFCNVSRNYKLSLFFLIGRNRKQYSCDLVCSRGLTAMCCQMLSAVIPDHVLGISPFRVYLLFIEVNKHMSTCVQSHLYSLYFYTVQMIIGAQINMFSQHCFLPSPIPMTSRGQLFSL